MSKWPYNAGCKYQKGLSIALVNDVIVLSVIMPIFTYPQYEC